MLRKPGHRYILTVLYLLLSAVWAYAQPNARFTASVTSGCSPLSVNFTNTTSGGTGTLKYLWKFGNSNTSTLTSPTATYYTAKTYTVTLIATDAAGKTDSTSQTISVYGNPTADLKADVTSGCPPLAVTFTDNSSIGTGNITSWQWDFGDGVNSSKQNPGTHSYSTPGKYTVTLVVTDKYGCSNTVAKKDLIVVSAAPSVDFSASSSGACSAPVSISFTSSVNPSSSSYNYAWDFGDGGSSTSANPSYTYKNAGTYTVSLKVSDNSGCAGSVSKSDFIFIGSPKADFGYSPGKGCAPLNVSFTDNSTGIAAGTTFSWDFGDGGHSADQNPSHTFAVGTYSVTLTVTSAAGCKDVITKSNIITVSKGFTPSFTADSVLCQSPFTTTFKNTSGAGISVVSWNFGDHTTSTAQSPTHTYDDSFDFRTVTLIATDANGCVESVTKPNFIHSSATSANLGYISNEGCAPFTFSFKNNSSSIDQIVSYKWDFGDGTTSASANPGSHTYTDTGYFILSLVVTTQKGCTANTTVKISSGSHPKAGFNVFPTSGCLNNMRHVHFVSTTNSSPGGIKADRYLWSFGDGESSSDPSPVHTYDIKPGKYDVRLTVYNKGCADSLNKLQLITIKGPFAQHTVKQDNCSRNVVHFFDKSINANRVKYVFGDGGTDTARNPTHVYNSGTFRPYEIVYNDTTGCSDTFSLYTIDPLIIMSPWAVSITTNSTTKGCAPVSVDFIINDNDSADNVIYFGNGDSVTVSSIKNPSQVVTYTYNAKGTYKVSLKATNVKRCQVKLDLNQTIIVNGPDALFNVDKTKGCVPLKILLTDKSAKDTSVVKKIYDMGNGDIINVTRDTISYTYTKPPANQYGGFTITEKVSDRGGCTNTYTRTVYPSLPHAFFNIDSNKTCTKAIYSFIPTDEGLGAFTYDWDLGNGLTSTQKAPVLTYNDGLYHIKLKMTDANGCIDTTSRFFRVKKTKSKADFITDSITSKCPPFHVSFIDQSRFASGGYHGYDWDFGDGSPHSSQASPQKIYYEAGIFDVTLKITDSLGCADSVTKKGFIKIKGAIGSYTIDPKRGCTPLTVNFKAVSKNALHFLWDFGDGAADTSRAPTHIYQDTRHYLPSLILTDSFGCTYGIPPKDTIYVDPLPVPDFTYDSICSGLPTFFTDKSNPAAGKLVQWSWDFGDGGTGTGPNPQHVFAKNGIYKVSLQATNSAGCTGKNVKNVKIGGITADFTSGRTGCVGSPVKFNDKTNSDTTIASWFWNFGDGATSTLQNPEHTYFKKGKYAVSLMVTNVRGCEDSTSKSGYLVIGDTTPPPPPVLYRVTVVDDNSVEIDFSKYKDVDFDHYVIYMADPSGNYSAIDQTNIETDTAHIVRNLNTLHNVYWLKVQAVNACGRFSALSPPHSTIDVTALPGPDVAYLSWTPYNGWQNVDRYKIYRMSYYNPPGYALIDSVPGNQLTYNDSNTVCYRTDIYRVAAVEKGGYGQISWSDTSTTLPVHINRVPAANMLRATVPDNRTAMIEWKDTATVKVKKWLVEKSEDGINYTQLDTPFNRNITSVKDFKVDVQKQSYFYRMRIMDSCGDLGPYSDYGKTILLKADTTPDVKPYLHWSAYKNWPEGVQYYDIEIKDENGNYRHVGRTPTGKDTTYIDVITDLNSLPAYCYRVVAHRNGSIQNPDENIGITSMSNEACMNVKSRAFIPNVFTPNGDGLNDSFAVKGLFIREYRIKIFDRWGTKVFESTSLKDHWDGRYKNGKPVMDSYKYLIYIRGADNEVHFLSGFITILM